MRELEYRICRDRQNAPLVVLESPFGNGQEIVPDALRALATRLNEIANQAEQHDMGRGYMPVKATVNY